MSEAQQDDLFDNTAPADDATKEAPEAPEPKDDKPAEGEESGVVNTGEGEEAAGTPPEGEDGDSANKGKMIPEHRFKAALKEANEKYEALAQENAALKATPIPDKATDPEGHALHIRMEASKEVMREMKPDYETVIKHYVEMAKGNPDLNQKVADAPLPAKFAYDLAKKDMELRELAAMKDSPEYKEFQEWKKTKAAPATPEAEQSKVNKQVTDGLSKVPNLNRATNVTKSNAKIQEDDGLFEGAL